MPRASADLRWGTDNEEYAKIDQDALITFNPEAAGKSVKVRATVLVNNYATPIYREFTFNLAPDTQSVNVYNYGGLAYVADTSQNDIVIQTTSNWRGLIPTSPTAYTATASI